MRRGYGGRGHKAEQSFFCKKSEISRKAVYLNKSLIFPEKMSGSRGFN